MNGVKGAVSSAGEEGQSCVTLRGEGEGGGGGGVGPHPSHVRYIPPPPLSCVHTVVLLFQQGKLDLLTTANFQ